MKYTSYILFGILDAVGTLTSNPPATNGVLTQCPGVPLSFTCSHENVGSGATRWRITGTTSQDCNELVNHVPPVIEGDACGPFTIAMISNDTGSNVTSTLQLAAVIMGLDGASVECLDGASSSAESVGVINIQVVGENHKAHYIIIIIIIIIIKKTLCGN